MKKSKEVVDSKVARGNLIFEVEHILQYISDPDKIGNLSIYIALDNLPRMIAEARKMKDDKLTKYLKLVKVSFTFVEKADRGIHTFVVLNIYDSLTILLEDLKEEGKVIA